MPGRHKLELARGRAVKDPGLEHAVVYDRHRTALDPLAIERARALPALAQRIIDDANAGLEQLLPELVAQEARLARDCVAVDGAGEMSNQAARDPPIEHHRHSLGRDLAWIEPRHRALARRAPDPLRRIEIGGMQRR